MLNNDTERLFVKRTFNDVRELTDECWQKLMPLFEVRKLHMHGHFIMEGSIAEELAIIASGVVRIYYLDDAGLEWNHDFLTDGDLVTAGISARKSSLVSIQALTDVTLYTVRYDAIEGLIETFPELELLLQRFAMDYLEHRRLRDRRLLNRDVLEDYLLYKERYADVEASIADHHVASYLGVSPAEFLEIRKEAERTY